MCLCPVRFLDSLAFVSGLENLTTLSLSRPLSVTSCLCLCLCLCQGLCLWSPVCLGLYYRLSTNSDKWNQMFWMVVDALLPQMMINQVAMARGVQQRLVAVVSQVNRSIIRQPVFSSFSFSRLFWHWHWQVEGVDEKEALARFFNSCFRTICFCLNVTAKVGLLCCLQLHFY